MHKIALMILAANLYGCEPSVEFADVSTTSPRPLPQACVAGPAPKFVSVEGTEISPGPATAGPVVLDPQSNGALLLGALTPPGVYPKGISVLDVATFEHHALTLKGDTVEVPVFGAGVWDAENKQMVVLGGTAGQADLAQVFTIHIDGNAAIIKRLPDFPIGSAYYPAMAYDPIGKRVLVVAYIHAEDKSKELAYRSTYALDLTPGAENWSLFVPGESGPPQVQLGESRKMVYDPARGRMILATSGTKSTLGSAYVLDLRDPKQWIGLAGTFPGSSVTDPSLVWDEHSCSFLYFTRTKAACGFDAWTMDVGDSVLASSPLGNAAFGSDGPAYGHVLVDAPRDRLLVLGGTDCSSGTISNTIESMMIER